MCSCWKGISEELNTACVWHVFFCNFRIGSHYIIGLLLHIWSFCNVIVKYKRWVYESLILFINCLLKYPQLLHIFISDKLTQKHIKKQLHHCFDNEKIMAHYKTTQAFQNYFLECFISTVPWQFLNEVLYTS